MKQWQLSGHWMNKKQAHREEGKRLDHQMICFFAFLSTMLSLLVSSGRPPPNEDGTPAETLSDQVVRLTNLVSGESEVNMIFVDLSCMVL
jgi:hypothetical protein